MNLLAGLGIAIIFVSGIFSGTIPTIISIIGGALVVVGWAYAMIIAARARQTGWMSLLAIGAVIALALGALSFTRSTTGIADGALATTQLGIFSLAFIVFAWGLLGGSNLMERGVAAYFGGLGLLNLVLGGTLVGGAIGTTIGASAAYITAFGFRMYTVSGVLGLLAWIVGLVVGQRTKAWSWFALIILLPGIGAFMFGLFGPTRQDVLMAQENARQRKAVGLN